jgi:2-polyprenyl-3-methyl-5-hydroxy-6-metoxy-1,4-benzoquinol methylase
MANQELDRLKKVWEGRASEDAMYYIDTDVTNQDANAFFENGKKDVATYVDPFLSKYKLDASTLSCVDLGCGMGRLSRALGTRFKTVHGFDISEEMIQKAKAQLLPEEKYIHYNLTSGDGFGTLDQESIGFLFTFIVLQHVPSETIVYNYLKDLQRILKPDGHALMQVNGIRRSFYQRLQFRIAKSQKIPLLKRKVILKMDPHSTMGVTFTKERISALISKAGLKTLAITGVGTQHMWLEINK